MLKLVKAEIQYNGLVFSMLPLFTFFVTMYEISDSGNSSYFVYFIALILLSSVYSNRRNEKRDRQLVALPVSSLDIGLARIAVLLLGIVIVLITYFLIHIGIGDLDQVEWSPAIALICLLVSIYSVMFILIDLFPLYVKRVKGIAIVVCTLVTLGGILTFIFADSTGSRPDYLYSIIDFLVSVNPFSGSWGIFRLILFTLALAFSSAFTYQRRRSFI